MNLAVLYEDEWLAAIDKPAGLLTIPTPKKESRTLTSILNDDLKQKGLAYRLRPCHRLDRDTSGVIIYAKGKSSQKKMMELFRLRKIKKTYLAFAQGVLSNNQGQVDSPIEGGPSLTRYIVIEKRKDFSIIEVMPVSGRTNQIRIHLKAIGHPLVGETKYAFRRDFKLKAKRLCLHAKELSFTHPMTNQHLHLVSELPADLRDFLEKHA
ncbi:MAG: RluA family pseudouridine synthase [Candidatus Omnitrophica bacterium]|nr:RluA family pseudouridine synthase [Candidatus Omnitrophota bacterium]